MYGFGIRGISDRVRGIVRVRIKVCVGKGLFPVFRLRLRLRLRWTVSVGVGVGRGSFALVFVMGYG